MYATVSAALGYIYFGYNSALMNSIQDNLQQIYKWDKSEKSYFINILQSVLPIFGLIGSLLCGPLMRRIGRRKTIIATAIFSSIGNLLTLIEAIEALILGRMLVGLGVGFFTVVVP
jgi:MFS family permease